MSKFTCITADPPYSFSDTLKMSDVARGAEANYSVMNMTALKNLPVKDLANPNGCVLALWVPSSLLQDGLDIMNAWGFAHKQTYIWVKSKKDIFSTLIKSLFKEFKNKPFTIEAVKNSNSLSNFKLDDSLAFGMGRLFRQTHEICLLGTNNTKIYKKLVNKSQRSVSFGENLKHSAKPEHLQDSLDLMFPNCNKIELFSRRQKPNWICLGNQAPMCMGEDIKKSIDKAIHMSDEDILELLSGKLDVWNKNENVTP